MFHEFNIQVANREDYVQLLHDFEGNNSKYFSWGLVMFSEGEYNQWSALIPGLIWTGLQSWAWQFSYCRVQADQPE